MTYGEDAGVPAGAELSVHEITSESKSDADAYEEYVRILSSMGLKEVKTGEFGAHMDVEICNDGPVTVMLDTQEWKR